MNYQHCQRWANYSCCWGTVSLYNKLSELGTLITACNNRFSLICVTESWLHDHNVNLINLPNFNFVYKNRITNAGGGVGLFINNGLKFFIREDLFYFSSALNC